jgi:hypothetical protein
MSPLFTLDVIKIESPVTAPSARAEPASEAIADGRKGRGVNLS